MKNSIGLTLNENPESHQSVVDRLSFALESSDPQVKEWLKTGVMSMLAQIPFLHAQIGAKSGQVPKTSPDRSIDIKEASKLLNIPSRWIYRHKNKIPHNRFGRYIRFNERALLKWAEQRQNQSG